MSVFRCPKCWNLLFYFMKRSIHKLEKNIDRERRHKDWLESNLKQSKQLRESKKQILKLQTELAFAKQQTDTNN